MIAAAALCALLLLGLAAIPLGRSERGQRIVYAATAAAALALIIDGMHHLSWPGQEAPSIVLPLFGLPWMGLHFRIDALSAFFLVAINVPSFLASIYGIGYGGHAPEPRRILPFFPLFLFGMNGVLVADDAFAFLVSWEFMSLSSWLLVLSNHRDPECRRAGTVYLIMAMFGTFCLLPAFGLMAGSAGAYDFASMRAASLSGSVTAMVVALTLLGAGSKAGIAPLHAWLPIAHPAAPSHVSALMSGVMTKVAIYGIIRVLFDLSGEIGWAWGFVMMVVGALTAVLGILYALMQTDLKKLLAYSTVENVGVITIALGLAAAFRGHGALSLSALALVAALYHVVSHSLFKSLLFLGAGAVQMATGERELDRLGGLLKVMPATGFCFLIGAAAISSLPPLNGFVSEWLVLQTLFKGPTVPHWAMRFGVPVVGVAIALSAALSAVCFVRVFGVAFLGRPRSDAARNAAEVGLPMRAAMAIPAFLCLCLGVVPVMVTTGIATVVEPLAQIEVSTAALGWPWLSPISATAGSYSATMVLITGAVLFTVAVFVVHRFGTRRTRIVPIWDCGHAEDNAQAQYSAESVSQPLRRVFGSLAFAAREQVEMPPPGSTAPARFSLSMIDPIWDGLYRRVVQVTLRIADFFSRTQFLTIRQYLLMMFATLVILLLVVAVRQQWS